MANYGLIDCGSNTVRLCIYQVKDDKQKTYRRRDLKYLLNHKTMCGLSAHVVDGSLTAQGVKRANEAIADHLRCAKYFSCKRLDVFATAFLRNCINSSQALSAIEAACGVPVTLLSSKDEAHLGFLGTVVGQPDVKDATLIDVGGGSTEIVRIEGGNDYDDISIPQGSLSSYNDMVRGVLPSGLESRQISDTFRRNLLSKTPSDTYRNKLLYGIGGSVRAVAKVYGELFCEGKRPSDLSFDDVDRVIRFAQRDPAHFAHCALRASADRIHTILPGCLIIRTLMSDFGAEQLHICKCGLREGYLTDRML